MIIETAKVETIIKKQNPINNIESKPSNMQVKEKQIDFENSSVESIIMELFDAKEIVE